MKIKNFKIISKKTVVIMVIFIITLSTYFPKTVQAIDWGGIIVGGATGYAACELAGYLSSLVNKSDKVMIPLGVPSYVPGPVEEGGKAVAKDCILDGGAGGLKRGLIRSLVKDTLKWINSGFEGAPAFGDNLEQMARDTTSRVLDDLIYGTGLDFLCTGFELPIKFALQVEFFSGGGTSADKPYKPKCTIDNIKSNVNDATNDVKDFYSWNNFLEVTTNTDNNAFGAYFNASKDARKIIAKTNSKFSKELDRNNGFFSYRKCSAEYIKKRKDEKKPAVYDGTEYASKHCKVTTAGTTLAAKFNSTLDTEKDELISADEFNEIIGAVLDQAMSRMLVEGGASETAGGYSDYVENYVDETVKSTRIESLKKYYPGLQTFIREINEKILKNLKEIEEKNSEALNCWNDHKDDIGKRVKWVSDDIGAMEIDDAIDEVLTSLGINAINSAIEYHEYIKTDFIDKEIEEMKVEIAKLEKKELAFVSIYKEILKLRSVSKLKEKLKIVNKEWDTDDNKSNINILDLDREIPVIIKKQNEVYGGKFSSYNKNGNVVKGGIMPSSRYCVSFKEWVVAPPTTGSKEIILHIEQKSVVERETIASSDKFTIDYKKKLKEKEEELEKAIKESPWDKDEDEDEDEDDEDTGGVVGKPCKINPGEGEGDGYFGSSANKQSGYSKTFTKDVCRENKYKCSNGTLSIKVEGEWDEIWYTSGIYKNKDYCENKE